MQTPSVARCSREALACEVGNAAGVGARQMLLSTRQRQRASQLVERVHYVELTIEPTFEPAFVDAMYF